MILGIVVVLLSAWLLLNRAFSLYQDGKLSASAGHMLMASLNLVLALALVEVA